MAKRKGDRPRRTPGKKDKELQAIYDRVRREFSAADLQKYTEIEKGIPLEKVIADMEAIQRRLTRKRS
jgi:hypothetical protein